MIRDINDPYMKRLEAAPLSTWVSAFCALGQPSADKYREEYQQTHALALSSIESGTLRTLRWDSETRQHVVTRAQFLPWLWAKGLAHTVEAQTTAATPPQDIYLNSVDEMGDALQELKLLLDLPERTEKNRDARHGRINRFLKKHHIEKEILGAERADVRLLRSVLADLAKKLATTPND